jgi:hypothetical protein
MGSCGEPASVCAVCVEELTGRGVLTADQFFCLHLKPYVQEISYEKVGYSGHSGCGCSIQCGRRAQHCQYSWSVQLLCRLCLR